jgi:large subunit ribosomal protein L35
MPKIKTHRGAAKRFNKTGTGKVTRAKAFKQHILTSKSTKRLRGMRGTTLASPADTPRLEKMIPYK